MSRPNQTGYPFIHRDEEKFGVAINRKTNQFRKRRIPSLWDAVQIYNALNHDCKYTSPPNPYKVLDDFLRKHHSPGASVPFGAIFDSIKGPWELSAGCPLTRQLLSKLLRARGYYVYRCSGTLKVRSISLL